MAQKEGGKTILNDDTPKNDIMYVLKPAMVYENCFGIFRFSIMDGKLLPPSRKMKIFSILMALAYTTMLSVFLCLPSAVSSPGILMDIMDEVPSIVILVQYLTTAMTTSFLLSNINIEIITKFADIDSMLIRTGKDFYRKSRSRYQKFLLLLTISQSIIFGISLFTVSEFTVRGFLVLPLYLMQKLEIVVFCLLISMLKCRLAIINKYISKFINEKNRNVSSVFTVCEEKNLSEKFNMIGRISESNTKIRDLATMYDTIGRICSLINDLFNFQIFMTLVSTFTYIVITIWTSLYYYRTPENNTGPLITITVWCISTIMTVAGMCFACETLLSTRNSTKILVNLIIIDYDIPKTMRVQAKAFMELIEAWPLRILIYDMFSVDITLMLKFISVATTYLIVIVQITHFL